MSKRVTPLSIGRRRLLVTTAGVLAATTIGATTYRHAIAERLTAGAPHIEGQMPNLSGAIGWINAPPLTEADLSGKVVLVEFWTYTCINWLRSHPYVRAWADKYKDAGLVVIGVHTPEFPFEKDIQNVRQAVQAMRITYPVAVDSNYAVWRAFENEYWPAFYIVDAQGRIRHHQFGEGDYGRSEAVIQQLLAEAGATNVNRELVAPTGLGAETAADWNNLRSSETYLGYQQAEGFSSPGAVKYDGDRDYAMPAALSLNHWAVSGGWTIEQGRALSNKAGGRIAYRFHARDVHLVMGATIQDRAARFRVTIDSAPPGDNHGSDVDPDGWGSAQFPRLYQLVRQTGAIADRTFEIEFPESGMQAYVFTFS